MDRERTVFDDMADAQASYVMSLGERDVATLLGTAYGKLPEKVQSEIKGSYDALLALLTGAEVVEGAADDQLPLSEDPAVNDAIGALRTDLTFLKGGIIPDSVSAMKTLVDGLAQHAVRFPEQDNEAAA